MSSSPRVQLPGPRLKLLGRNNNNKRQDDKFLARHLSAQSADHNSRSSICISHSSGEINQTKASFAFDSFAGKTPQDKQPKRRKNLIEQLTRSKRSQLSRSHNEMSQTLQSIQSLSMQLNRAASLGGSQQLDSSAADELANEQRADYMAREQQDGKLFVGRKLTRLVGKKATRVKELVLQNLGKAERTKDELFKIYEENFYRQQAHAVKLQRELKSYIGSLRSSQEAGKTLNECIQLSTSDYQSVRHDLVCESLAQLEHLEADLMDKLREQVLSQVSEYLGQFGELRDKIAKRHRKLIDFDSSRRLYELTLASVNKRRHQQVDHMNDPMGAHLATSQLVDEARLLKLREQYNYCRLMYETINGELHEQLPMIYEKKMKSMLMTLHSYFALEARFHLNAGKLFSSASEVIDELPTAVHLRQELAGQQLAPSSGSPADYHVTSEPASEAHHNAYHRHSDQFTSGQPLASSQISHSSGSLSQSELHSSEAGADQFGKLALAAGSGSSGMGSGHESPVDCSSSNGSMVAEQPANQATDATSPDHELADDEEQAGCCDSLLVGGGQLVGVVVSGNEQEAAGEPKGELNELADQLLAAASAEAHQQVCQSQVVGVADQTDVCSAKEEEEEQQKEAGHGRPLYKVKTIYKYLAEDVDELCFEADEVIQVVEFEENQDQEEGWLMGVREVNGQRGLFPANFTCPF